MSEAIEPFVIDVPQAAIDDLHRRLDATRWPEAATVDDWGQGVPLDRARALVDHWRHRYDWRRCEATLNAAGSSRTEIDGLGIHFLHVRSPHDDALPLVMTHGWPGSVAEFLDTIGPLTRPEEHGGRAEDAFHLVIPSLPGFGFSDKPVAAGWGVERIADAWTTLMARLGYHRWGAQGGDWGAAVTTALGVKAPARLAGIHLNMVVARPDPDSPDLTAKEKRGLAKGKRYQDELSGYSKQQATRPQTIGYSLVDSPVGQAMWIFEKFHDWTDCDGDPIAAFGADRILDTVTLYWLTASGASSARLYWESFGQFGAPDAVDVPAALSQFPEEIGYVSRRWAEKRYRNIVHWGEPARGGHFAAFEQPALFVEEVRAGFRAMR